MPSQSDPTVTVDVVMTNGQGFGDMANKMLLANGDAGFFRPYVEGFQMDAYGRVIHPGQGFMTVNQGTAREQILRDVSGRNDATLLHEEWLDIDDTLDGVVGVYRKQLSAWEDLKRGTRPYRTKNGIGTLQLLTQTVNDPGVATISMTADTPESNFRRKNDATMLPIPLIYCGFTLDVRELLASRAGARPLDLDQLEMAARRVLEAQDALTVGSTTFAGPGGTIQGYTSYTGRATATLTTPTGNFGPTMVAEVSAILNTLMLKNMYGPYVIYYGQGWDTWMQLDYSTVKGEGTARDRLLKLRNVQDVKLMPNLTGYQMVILQMDSQLMRPIIGQEPVVVQWESNGGATRHFRVVACGAPQLRLNGDGNSGIVHANV